MRKFVIFGLTLLLVACGGTVVVPPPSATATGGTGYGSASNKPAWIDNPYGTYSQSQYVTAVGNANDRSMAEKQAIANLISYFEQNIHADQTVTNRYEEVMKTGVGDSYVNNFQMQSVIKTSSSMESLLGVEIRETWFDNIRTHYAIAVMEKSKATEAYTEAIKANLTMIENLINMTPAQKNTLDGFSRYQLAAIVAEMNMSHANLLRLIGSPVPAGIEGSTKYRDEVSAIIKTIPVTIKVKNDKANRVQGAFAKVLSDIGFRSGGDGSQYVLEVELTVSRVENPMAKFISARMECDAKLTDGGVTILPYNFDLREGHASYSEAENRVFASAEKEISTEYSKRLNEYLSARLPQKR
jgi:hypothetical protein